MRRRRLLRPSAQPQPLRQAAAASSSLPPPPQVGCFSSAARDPLPSPAPSRLWLRSRCPTAIARVA